MSFKSFFHWLASMGLSAFAAWWLAHHPADMIPTVMATGCASHWVGHLGGQSAAP